MLTSTKATSRRIVSALCIIPLVAILSITVSADSATDIGNMGNKMFEWYKVIRYVSVWFMILSLANCGFKYVSRAFLQSPKYTTDDIVVQLVTSAVAFMVLYNIPYIIGKVKDFFSATGWRPETAAVLEFLLGRR